VKLPVPEPSLVFVLKEMVGVGLVDHITPLEITAAPPSVVILPPVVADVVVMELADNVLNVGSTTGVLVVKVISFP
jgi:phospholipid N-methyltransferase